MIGCSETYIYQIQTTKSRNTSLFHKATQPTNNPANEQQISEVETTNDQRMCDNFQTSHAIANVEGSESECESEVSGVFWQRIREMQPYHNAPNYMSCRGDYHLFAKHGDKVYMEVRNAGEIVISFAELQKNKYWKYYYDLSLILANDKHKVIKNKAFNVLNTLYKDIYDYKGDRKWSFETAYIDQSDLKNFKIIPSGNVCYFKINPADVEGMEYSTQQELERFELGYMNGLERVKYFLSRSVIYKNIAIEYQASKTALNLISHILAT